MSSYGNPLCHPMGTHFVILSEAKDLKNQSEKPQKGNRMGKYYVYILTNKNNKVMYIGVTNNIQRRLYEHKTGLIEGFTKKYNVHKLVWFEETCDVKSAIEKEKQLKGWKRERKNQLVSERNPEWKDLSDEW